MASLNLLEIDPQQLVDACNYRERKASHPALTFYSCFIEDFLPLETDSCKNNSSLTEAQAASSCFPSYTLVSFFTRWASEFGDGTSRGQGLLQNPGPRYLTGHGCQQQESKQGLCQHCTTFHAATCIISTTASTSPAYPTATASLASAAACLITSSGPVDLACKEPNGLDPARTWGKFDTPALVNISSKCFH